MPFYKAKPVIVEAYRLPPLTVDMDEDALALLHHVLRDVEWESDRDGGLTIHALDDDLYADPGDWVVRYHENKHAVLPHGQMVRDFEPMTKETTDASTAH